jgi:membrane protein DedA with SNARE-associated domain
MSLLPDLTQYVSGSPWSYVLVAAVPAGDAVLPLLPGETRVITAAALSANGTLFVGFVLLAAFVGAVAGDNAAYGLGDWIGEPAARRLFHGEKSRKRLDWARDQLHERGRGIIVVARFIPGGRTATTFAAGTLSLPWRRKFLPADALGAGIWSLVYTGLGYLGGKAFEHNIWIGVAIGLGIGFVFAGIGELVRRKRLR